MAGKSKSHFRRDLPLLRPDKRNQHSISSLLSSLTSSKVFPFINFTERERERMEGISGEKQEELPLSTSPEGYLVVRHDRGGWADLLASWDRIKEVFLDGSTSGCMLADSDQRWVILVSIFIRKIIALFRKPMELMGVIMEFLLNLISQNGGIIGLFLNLFTARLIVPRKGSETFISIIGQLDRRVDLHCAGIFNMDMDLSDTTITCDSNLLMDLCIMASKLAYENASVVRNVIDNHWKMHFVDFYNCWNEYQKERSTQVFIFCDKPKDADLVVVSFRGTEPFDADDWITDWDYSWYEIPGLGKVHMGFLEALGLGSRNEPSSFMVRLHQDSESREVNDEETAYFTVRGRIKSVLSVHKKAKFVVTGHSLGGALAVLFPTLLFFNEEEELMKRLLAIYTFGQPRIGDQQLGRFMETHVCHPVSKYFRLVYCNDVVPRLPYDDKTFLYKHFGLCFYFNSLYKEKDVQEVPNRNYEKTYLLQCHLNAAWELIRGFFMGYTYGSEYTEGWFSILFRMMGLVLPGISDHCPRDYVNCVRLGRRIVRMSSI